MAMMKNLMKAFITFTTFISDCRILAHVIVVGTAASDGIRSKVDCNFFDEFK